LAKGKGSSHEYQRVACTRGNLVGRTETRGYCGEITLEGSRKRSCKWLASPKTKELSMTKKTNTKTQSIAPLLEQVDAKGSVDDTTGRVSVHDAPLGMFDQELIYPHLITEVGGIRVAVPLGEAHDGFNENYVVAPFTYQPVPQPEYEPGWHFEIESVKLLSRDTDPARFASLGSIKVHSDRSLFIYCMGYRGYTAWVPVPGCKSGKRPGSVYKRWEIIVKGLGAGENVIVRYNGDKDEFEHWPEDC
jgi:hypothetical protein